MSSRIVLVIQARTESEPYYEQKLNDKDILRACKFSKTQPRPVAKNATPRPLVRIELTTPANLVRRSAD